MAFQNFLSTPYYVNVDQVSYFKDQRTFSFYLNIYADASKRQLIASSEHVFSSMRTVHELEAVNVTTPPPVETLPADSQPKWGLALSGCTGAWENNCGSIAVSLPPPEPGAAFSWLFESKSGKEIYYAKDSGKFYEKGKTEEPWVEINYPPCKQTWDKFFASSVISAPGTNLYRQIYLWLKTQPGFEEAIEV